MASKERIKNRLRYHRLRALGYPAWMADHRSPAARERRKLSSNIRTSKATAEGRNQKARAKYYAKLKRLYGGDPTKNYEARFRWMMFT